MNAIEIEEAVTALSEAPFDRSEFPFDFLRAFGNKETTIKRLQSGASNKSDLGGVLQANNLHISIAESGQVNHLLNLLKNSPVTSKGKVRFVVATDGADFEAEDIETGETVACSFKDFPDHFGFFLPLAGISTVKQIRESSFDIRATSRLNKLYIELLKDNPEWGIAERRHQMNHLMARLIFCFFAEDTDIFRKFGIFSETVEKMSERDSSNTHQIISEIFRSMDTKIDQRPSANLPRWADTFPYVNGGLFSGSVEVPRFSKISRSYLLQIGSLDWTKINPDIFGSMIQAVADDEERGELGMHYTSVPNILKVLNPLFLDDLREQLEEAGDNQRMLLNLRKRISRIRVFDPACGSGNFLVIAYKQLREIENIINERRGEIGRSSEIPLTNFRGIELRDFSAEIARLALVIAEYQCDLLYRGQKEALAVFLPLDSQNWITSGNALQIDWLSVCPPTGTAVKFTSDDLFNTPIDQAQIEFANEGGETYICGNPPYLGSRRQGENLKDDLEKIAASYEKKWRSLDYACAWIFLAKRFQERERCGFAFVTTSSLCEGLHVSLLWKHIIKDESKISFAHRPFKWKNLAARNAGVSVVVVGVSNLIKKNIRRVFDGNDQIIASNINAYLTNGNDVYVATIPKQISAFTTMLTGAMPRDGGNLILSAEEATELNLIGAGKFIRRYLGSEELINGKIRFCIWVDDKDLNEALSFKELEARFEKVRENRLESPLQSTKDFASWPYRFVYVAGTSSKLTVAIGAVSSENRTYLPVDCFAPDVICSNRVYAIYDGSLIDFSILSTKLHMAWAFAVCGRLEQRLSYSNTLGWNTFPIPHLTEKNKVDLMRCAQNILLIRESHYPLTIAELYEQETMPADLRAAHEKNDEVLERVYIGRSFRNDTERLEKLFELYTKMTSKSSPTKISLGTTI